MTPARTRDESDHEATDITGLARRGILSLGGAGVSAVANLLLIVVVSRAAGQEMAGYLFSSTSLFIVIEGLCALGTATGVVYFIARSRALEQHHLVRPILRTAVLPVVLVSLLAALAMFLLAPLAGKALAGGTAEPEPVLFLRILAPFLPFAVLYDVLIAATQGFHTMTPTVVLEKVGRPVFQLALMGMALTVGLSWMLPLAWMGPYLIGLTGVTFSLRRLLRRHHRESPPLVDGEDPPAGLDRRRFWVFTAPRGLAAVAQLSLQRLDIVLVAVYLGAEPAAVYTAATRFVVLGQLGSQAVALAVQPKLSELMAREDIPATSRVYQTSTAWVVAVTWPVHLVVAMLSPLLMQLFGRGYDEGQPLMVVLAGAMLVATGCGMVTMLLLMSGRSRENLANVLVALVTNLALNIILIPRIGIMGAAIAWAVAIVLSNLLPLVQVHRAYGLAPFGPGTARVAALSMACFGLLPGVAWLASGEAPVVIGAVCLGGLLYAGGLLALRRILELDDLVQSVRRKVSTR